MTRKLIIGFPRCGNQSHFETYGTSSLEDLIYDPKGIEYFQKTFPGYEPMILVRASRWEHAYSNWCRMRKIPVKKIFETRPFKDCYKEYLEKANFDKYIEPWLKAYPDIEIIKLEDLMKDPNFLHIDNFSIPHDTKNDKRLQEVMELIE